MSRDELVAEAVVTAAETTGAGVLSRGKAGLAAYLSKEHLAHPESGCVLAALGTEGRAQSPMVRRTFAKVARGFVDHVHKGVLGAREGERVTDEALALAARMIGAVILARLVDDDALAERILKAARDA